MTRTLWPRIMLIGKNGQVGWELQHTLAPLGEVAALDRQQLDLSDPKQIRERVREIKPNLIVNAAAYTAVDKAENDRGLAMAINGNAPGILAEEAKRIGAAVVHYSTDYVFDGTKITPYTEEDAPNPINEYGRTKLAGEQAVQASGTPYIIVRTSWVYGMRGNNFLLTILRLAREREELKIVNDQTGAPTWSRAIAEATGNILSGGQEHLCATSGIYHMTASGSATWYEFAKAIVKLDPNAREQICKHIKSIPSVEYPTPARRPTYSLLSNSKLKDVFGYVLNDWEQELKMALYSS